MGDAKRRAEARLVGQPWAQDLHRCPACASRNVVVGDAPAMGLSHVGTLYGACRDCRTSWEAFPADWKHDAVEASPCDNCAFAPGAPEQADRHGWRSLLAKLKLGTEFRCHKGAPLIIDEATGTVEFDGDWINQHGRTCAGFLRVMQQWPDWLENRVSAPVHVLTTHDQDLITGGSLREAEEAFHD